MNLQFSCGFTLENDTILTERNLRLLHFAILGLILIDIEISYFLARKNLVRLSFCKLHKNII